MKKVKTLVVGLVLALAGVAYASGGSQSTPQACNMDNSEGSCCVAGASCCTGNGSCCAMKTAQR